MKVTGVASGRLYTDRKAIVLYPLDADMTVVEKLFAHKARREEKDGGNVAITYELEVEIRPRTYKQLNTVWALIRILYISMNGEPPTKEQSYDLYLDVLDLYANKKPNRFNGTLRPVHLSESDTEDAANLISHIMNVIVEYADLTMDLQADVRKLFFEWENNRGGMDRDPLDYDEQGNPLPYEEWRKKHQVSHASGRGGYLERAHIVSRGANAAAIEESWNWLMLTTDEHRDQHQIGWTGWIEKYPHLKSRVLRARQLAGA
jgi:hypothetical protein